MRLWDMHKETQLILEFMKDVSYAKFTKSKMIRYAVERSLLILGEAANHISPQFQSDHDEIPWHQIIGQRNVLAHEYGDIKVDRVWVTITKNIPKLLLDLGNILDSN